MKKVLCVMVLCAAILGAAYSFEFPALALSAGGGVLFTLDPSGGAGVARVTGVDKIEWIMTSFGSGGYGYLDATYGELSVALNGGTITQQREGRIRRVTASEEGSGSFLSLTFGLLGKFPYTLTGQLSVFPLAGIEYQVYLSAKEKWPEGKTQDIQYKTKNRKADLKSLWVRFGGGVDFFFAGDLYLRGELMYGLRLANAYERDLKKLIGGGADAFLGHGGQVRIAAGFRFKTF